MLQLVIQRAMHGFIINDNNFQNYNEYTYKARRTKYYIGGRRGFRNKHATYWSGRNITYSDSRLDPN